MSWYLRSFVIGCWPGRLKEKPAGMDDESYHRLCHKNLDTWEKPRTTLWGDLEVFSCISPIGLFMMPFIALYELPYEFARTATPTVRYCDEYSVAAKSIRYRPHTFFMIREDHPRLGDLADIYVSKTGRWSLAARLEANPTMPPVVAEKMRQKLSTPDPDRHRGFGGGIPQFGYFFDDDEPAAQNKNDEPRAP